MKKSIQTKTILLSLCITSIFLTSACTHLIQEKSYDYPAWTPDGKIVYWYGDFRITRADILGTLKDIEGGTSLHIMDEDGNNDRKLFDAPSYGAFRLSVSTDGTKILNAGQILDINTGKEIALNEEITLTGDWSPDSKKIVYATATTIKIWDVSSNVVTDTGLDGTDVFWKYNNNFIYISGNLKKSTEQGNVMVTFNYMSDSQYTNDGKSIIGFYITLEGDNFREQIDISTKETIKKYKTDSLPPSPIKISPLGNKIIWNTTESPTRKSIWIENIDGTGRICLKQSI